MRAYASVDLPEPFGPMTAWTSPGVHGEVDALDDLGAVLERDVQVLQLQQGQVCASLQRSERLHRPSTRDTMVAGRTPLVPSGDVPFGIGATEIIILLVVALIVFGPKRLPEMGRSLGRGMREFKDSISGKDDDDERAAARARGARRRTRTSRSSRRASATPSLAGPPWHALLRRLAHGEEATLVEHLGELRTRL